jgi:hypothetical protein
MTQNSVREKLFGMFGDGMVALQEVPRSQDRAPSRNLYLWKVSADIRDVLLQHLYKTVVNRTCALLIE